MPVDLAVLRRPRQTFEADVAVGPIHVPKTFHLGSPDTADTGTGHTVDFRPIPRLGPPLRKGTVGVPMIWYGGNSYLRGGGPATGHIWRVYPYTASSDHGYLAGRGAEITTGKTLLDEGATLQWTPPAEGTYAIELHFPGVTEGDNVDGPLRFGVRFVVVGAPTLQIVGDVNGPSGTLDQGGISTSFRYHGGTVLDHMQRAVLTKKLFYGTNLGPFEEYTWEPRGDFPPGYYAEEVTHSGFVQSIAVTEDARTHGIDVTLAGADAALQLLQIPNIILTVTDPEPGDPTTVRVTPTFFDQTLWELVQSAVAEEIETATWVHLVAGLRASDVYYHLLSDHSNFADFCDVAPYQEATDTIDSVETPVGSFWDALRAYEGGRFGRVYTDRKSICYIGPDTDLRPDIFRPAPVIALDGTLYRSISVTRQEPSVGQIVVQSADTLKASTVEVIKVSAGSELEAAAVQKVAAEALEAAYPAIPNAGAVREYPSARFFVQGDLDALAQLLHARDNAEFPVIELEMGLFPHLELNQPVTLELDPRTGEPTVDWSAGGRGILSAYVTGYTNSWNVKTRHWQTTLTVREATL